LEDAPSDYDCAGMEAILWHLQEMARDGFKAEMIKRGAVAIPGGGPKPIHGFEAVFRNTGSVREGHAQVAFGLRVADGHGAGEKTDGFFAIRRNAFAFKILCAQGNDRG